jgi:glucan biosynthesis protein C
MLVGVSLPAVVKFFIVLGVTTLVTVVTYHYFVRSTVIGWLLNGRKYPRALPQYDDAGELVVVRQDAG